VSEEANKKLRARNAMVQLLALYTDPERHSTPRDRRTDRRHRDANIRSYCAAVRPAKNQKSAQSIAWVRECLMSPNVDVNLSDSTAAVQTTLVTRLSAVHCSNLLVDGR